MPELAPCKRCGKPTPACELACYRGRCESCVTLTPYDPPVAPAEPKEDGPCKRK